jgi:hypothetical protein
VSFKKTVPSSAAELHEFVVKIHENQSHVKKIEVNLTTGHLEVTLDTVAHLGGNPDIYLPIKRAAIAAAQALVDKLLAEPSPSTAETSKLYDMIDHEAR